jgi:hypothetical protein
MRIQLAFICIIVSLLFSCGTNEQKSNDAIFMANVYLSNNRCNEALTELSKVDAEYYDYYYYQALASAKACRASYSVLDLIDELEDFTDTDSFFNFLAGLATSNETVATSANFTYLEDAINSILYIKSSTQAKFADRLTVITSRDKVEELGFQALLMIFVYMGKWLAHYGDTDAAGLKTGSVDCLLSYVTEGQSFLSVAERTALLGATGTCLPASTDVSADLPFGTSTTRDRICKMIVYFNHTRDLASNITLSSHTSLGDLADAFTDLENFVEAAETAFPGISNVLTFYNVDSCNAYYDGSNAGKENIHAFMAGAIDENFQ